MTRPDHGTRLQLKAAEPAILRLWDRLTALRSVLRFAQTGAHPDDETSGLLAALRLRDGIATTYICATRGQGGQNAIGKESGTDLGALRKREMEEAARQIDLQVDWLDRLADDPADPLVDFGFAKSGATTLRHWGGKAELVARIVVALRRARPDIVCTTFLDVPGQHGHHRAMTEAVLAAIPLAADANFPMGGTSLPIHRVAKIYVPAWSGAGQSYDDETPPPPATVTYDASGSDPWRGLSYSRIGELSRGYHASQGMGRGLTDKPTLYPLHRLDQPVPEPTIFSGLPHHPRDLADDLKKTERSALLAVAEAIDQSIAAFPNRARIVTAIGAAMPRLKGLCAALATSHPQAPRLADLLERLLAAYAEASGWRIDIVPEKSLIARGERMRVAVEWDGALAVTGMPRFEAKAKKGFTIENLSAAGFDLVVGEAATLVNPWRAADEPGGATSLALAARWTISGEEFETSLRLAHPIIVVPPATFRFSPDKLVRISANADFMTTLYVTAHKDAEHRLTLAMPSGWTAQGLPNRFELKKGMELAIPLSLQAPPGFTGRAEIDICIDGEGAQNLSLFRYDHVGTVARLSPARLSLLSIDAKRRDDLTIGSISGGHDHVAMWLEHLGYAVTPLAEGALSGADLSQFDTILVGIFAFGSRKDLAAALPLLHDFVRKGGNLVTLYHRPWDGWEPERTPLARLAIGQPSLRWRVCDPGAKITHLAGNHPLLARPNIIGAADWEGWVKERGLYFAESWDEAYTPLLAMADEGEQSHRGALLTGRFGKGRHTHCALALHTQLDALVPGAFRLLANLVDRV